MPNLKTQSSKALERLKRDVIAGVFAFGSQLKIRDLHERYGISPSPMREALSRATQQGLVHYSDQKGFSVAPLSEEDLDDLLQTRLLLNEVALRKSIELGDQAWEETVIVAYHRLSRVPFTPILVSSDWENAHRAFHSALLAGCKIPRLLTICEQLFDSSDRYRFLSRIASPVERGDQHKPIMEAALARHADQAVNLLAQHFSETAERSRMELRRRARLRENEM